MPGRLESLADGKHCRDLVNAGAEPHRDFSHVGAQIAGFVEALGQFACDQR